MTRRSTLDAHFCMLSGIITLTIALDMTRYTTDSKIEILKMVDFQVMCSIIYIPQMIISLEFQKDGLDLKGKMTILSIY